MPVNKECEYCDGLISIDGKTCNECKKLGSYTPHIGLDSLDGNIENHIYQREYFVICISCGIEVPQGSDCKSEELYESCINYEQR